MGEKAIIQLSDSKIHINNHNGQSGADGAGGQAEIEQLRALLHEKELLLREANHRFKNQLQLINSFLHFQATFIQDQAALAALAASQRRIRSLALIHEQLSLVPDVEKVNIGEYIERLATGLSLAYEGSSPCPVGLELVVTNLALTVKQATTCGLIINELVSNAFEHAFPAGWVSPGFVGEIVITVESTATNGFMLEVGDNGVGLSSSEPEITTLGGIMIKSLVRQLNGRLSWQRNGSGGALCRITAPL